MPVSAHKKRQSVKFPLDLSVGKNKTYKLKRAIDRPTEAGNFSLSNLEYRNFFFVKSTVESGILGLGSWQLEFDDWNLEFPAWSPESKTVLSCVFVWLVQFNKVCFPSEFELPGFYSPTETGSITIIDPVIQIGWISKPYLPFASLFKLILFFVNSLGF